MRSDLHCIPRAQKIVQSMLSITSTSTEVLQIFKLPRRLRIELQHNLPSNGICLDVSRLDSFSNTLANSLHCFTVNKRLPFSTSPPPHCTASQKFKYFPVKFPAQMTNTSHFLDSFYNGILPFTSPSPRSIQMIIFYLLSRV